MGELFEIYFLSFYTNNVEGVSQINIVLSSDMLQSHYLYQHSAHIHLICKLCKGRGHQIMCYYLNLSDGKRQGGKVQKACNVNTVRPKHQVNRILVSRYHQLSYLLII